MISRLSASSESLSAGDAFSPGRYDAVLFDLDGVLTSTATLHAACWKKTFDEYLKARSARAGESFVPFDLAGDYRQFVDGKPRYDGVASFLESRGIHLPVGSVDAGPEEESVHGLGNRKDRLVNEAIREGKVQAFPGSVAFVRKVRELGLKTAVVSSSHHCAGVLRSAGIEELFDLRVDGELVDALGLPGKPAPDTYRHAAEELGVTAERAVVVEDAISGVQAGRAGGFGLVIGVDRGGSAEALRENGADVVVSDLSELLDSQDRGQG